MKLIKRCKAVLVEQTTCDTKKKYCCKKMKKVFDPKYKTSYSDGSGEWCNNWHIDWKTMKMTVPIRSDISMGDDYVIAREEISYCPFCGARITSRCE